MSEHLSKKQIKKMNEMIAKHSVASQVGRVIAYGILLGVVVIFFAGVKLAWNYIF